MNAHYAQLPQDQEGYLLNPADWNQQIAQEIAVSMDIQMTEAHWEIVRFVRAYYESHDSVPELRVTLKHLKSIEPKKATRKYVYTLFPFGYGQQACKIAGMRMPRKLMLDV